MLSADNHRHFWIPEGFAHGFCVLSEFATFTYQCSALYDPKADAGVRWDDPAIGIDWPLSAPLLSDKDSKTPLLKDIPLERLPVWVPAS
jgi:dTDP-4-dehydrorhamnose 3,5-epimerase